ncbi:MAG: hypothetical protein B7X39_19480 [Lysobacterales bacterium 14-68-21]|jgi:hypothetical protein|uniref:hypothetical protein n=1 Tax=Aerosticca soli TaxID=2010829 RepID=UPI000BC5238F|nr:hypothetical protein [Aerosticca soli]OZB63334.1 MAG: hypothetical protein B7X39_19480 [Xanthomonadales bacterium 14-68-21]
MTHSPDDRFGVSEGAFQAARESHGLNNPVYRMGMVAPTRHEVATLPAAELLPIVIDWIWESPSEPNPNNRQIGELRAILLTRPDVEAPEIQQLLSECSQYIEE